jgi:hypothetical protein
VPHSAATAICGLSLFPEQQHLLESVVPLDCFEWAQQEAATLSLLSPPQQPFPLPDLAQD